MTTERFAIMRGEHPCFGYLKEYDPECEMCDAYQCCGEMSDDNE
jgi:hypothetical protein